MFIDVHAHGLSLGFLESLCRRPQIGLSAELTPDGYVIQRSGDRIGFPGLLDKNLHDMPRRVESLRRRDVHLQLVAPPPGFMTWPGGALDVEGARVLNAQAADMVEEAGERLGGMAVVALGEPDKAADELRRAVDQYGFVGATIPTSAGGTPLDLPQFEPVISAFEELGLLVFMHPARVDYPPQLDKYRGYTVARFPMETTLAAMRFIFSGTMERHPGFHLILSHGGGTLPFTKGRLECAYNATGWEAEPTTHEAITEPPSAYLRRFFYDTNVLGGDVLQFVLSVVGRERVMFGSDYPFEIGDAEGALVMPTIEEMPASDRAAILGGNADAVIGCCGGRGEDGDQAEK